MQMSSISILREMGMRSLRDGFKLYACAVKSGSNNVYKTQILMHSCAKHGLIREAQNLFDEMPRRNSFTWHYIIDGYVKAKDFVQAQKLFEAAPQKDSITYRSLLYGYLSTDGYEKDAVKLFLELHNQNIGAPIDVFSLTRMLKLAAKVGELVYGSQLHCYMLKTANDLCQFAVSSLIYMYSKCGSLLGAWNVFRGRRDGDDDSVSKNLLMASCIRGSELEMASELFWSEPELNNQVSWNMMIDGYAQNGYEKEAIELFKGMGDEGYEWNEYSFASVLIACASLESQMLGKEIHARVIKDGTIKNHFVSSGLVNVYSRCGNMIDAELVNATIGRENAIVRYSATGDMVKAQKAALISMISGYLKSSQYANVFQLFRDFIQNNATVLDTSILVDLLGACSQGSLIDPGKQIHAYILKAGYLMDTKIVSSKIDMYAKCGNINYAQRIFQEAIQKDTALYNIMIGGYARHGFDNEAFQLFQEMKGKGIQPDAITFIALLTACRHHGRVEVGENYFESMTKEHAILPEVDHFACMIDLYGRANQLEKAIAFMRKLPVEHDAVILGTFLNACKSNKNVGYANEVAEKLLQFEGDNGPRYVQLASIYASTGSWDEMGRAMNQMGGKEVKKTA